PHSMASIRAKDLRSVLYDTWKPETDPPEPANDKSKNQTNDKLAKHKDPGGKAALRAQKKVSIPMNMDETMINTFWSYLEQKKYDKAERLAKYEISRDVTNPIGYQMQGVLNYQRGDYGCAARDAYKAMKLGSRHPKVVWLYKNSLARLKAKQQMSATDHNTAILNNWQP
ncbi:MAG: hypothetical protein K8F91_04780, partial [Candidatus Obscuribacterales bacterium]|nr:hypothetical protein [Candidatus Obscuribacterales bacterium]